MNNDKIVTPSFCYILAANFLLFFAFYLILPILPFYLKEEFMIGKSMIGFILSCYTLAALCIRPFAGYLLILSPAVPYIWWLISFSPPYLADTW